MDDALRKHFEAQFGTEWSAPVVPTQQNQGEPDSEEDSRSESRSESGSSDHSEVSGDQFSEGEEHDGENASDDSGPITVRHTESASSVGEMQKERSRFMSALAPKKGPPQENKKRSKGEDDDVANDLALQRLIQESHILSEHQGFTGADISMGDPMEHIGKARLKILEDRLEKAGAKRTSQVIPMGIAKGMKARAQERSEKKKEYAKEAGIILAREQRKKKFRTRDRGLKINSVGKASQYGITVSQAEIARVQRRRKRK